MNLTAYQDGLHAGHEWQAGVIDSIPDNPYTPGTEGFDDWNRGFNHGVDDEIDPSQYLNV